MSTKKPQSKGFNSVAVSPDGLRVAGGSDDFSIHLLDVNTGELQTVMSGHDAWVYCLSWSPNSCIIASASRDRSVRLWDVTTAESLQHSLELHARGCDDQVSADAEAQSPRDDDLKKKPEKRRESPEGGLFARGDAIFAFGRKAVGNVKSKVMHAMEETMEKVGDQLGDRLEMFGDLADAAQALDSVEHVLKWCVKCAE